jgi:hypothetical protein
MGFSTWNGAVAPYSNNRGCMLSISDLFTVGVGFDLLGGFFLGRGLLASPREIVRRVGDRRFGGGNPALVVSQLKSRADGVIGLVLLGVGFVLQAGGYVVLIGGGALQTGANRAAVAAGLLVAAGMLALATGLLAHRGLTKRLVVEAARVEPESGRLAKYPEGKQLLQFGQELGLVIEGDPAAPNVIDSFAKRNFGVARVSWQWRDPIDTPDADPAGGRVSGPQ